MPVKRRVSKRGTFRITPAVVTRWREVRPHGIHLAGQVCPAAFVADETLGDLVGQPALIAMRDDDAQALFDALEEAVDAN